MFPATDILLRELQKTLELETLLKSYASFIKHYLPLESLGYDHQEIHSAVIKQPNTTQLAPLLHSLNLENQFLGDISYYLRVNLSVDESAWLKECESTLLYPLCNAIQYRRLRTQAVRDQLTDLGNRVLLKEVLQQILNVQERATIQHAVMLLDLDNFKQVNDNHGHHCGDNVLAEFASILRKQLRGSDRLFRYGGDEFLVIISGPDEVTLQRVFRRLQIAMAEHNLLSHHGITCSAGSVVVKPAHTAQTLLEEADQVLYQAKKNGRNQLVSQPFVSIPQLG